MCNYLMLCLYFLPHYFFSRFDSLKYDVKKIEGIIYDLSIRGLLPKEADEGAAAGTKDNSL